MNAATNLYSQSPQNIPADLSTLMIDDENNGMPG